MEDPEPVMRHCRPVEILTDRDRLMRELEAFAGQDRRMGSSGGGTAAFGPRHQLRHTEICSAMAMALTWLNSGWTLHLRIFESDERSIPVMQFRAVTLSSRSVIFSRNCTITASVKSLGGVAAPEGMETAHSGRWLAESMKAPVPENDPDDGQRQSDQKHWQLGMDHARGSG